MFESRRRQSAPTGFRVLLWTLSAILATAVYLDNSPIVLDADGEDGDSITITREVESDVLVVIDYDAIAHSKPDFDGRDFSVAWINLFEQELGPVSISTPQSLSMDVLDHSRVVVLTSSVSDHIPKVLREKIRQHALDGHTIVLERPSKQLRQTFSANGRGGRRQAQSITYARGLAEPYNSQLLTMPLATQFVGSTSPRADSTTLLAIDGSPAIYATPIGKGTAITVDFDFGQQMVALQQGLPTADFSVEPAKGGAPPKTSALIMDPGLRSNAVPFADLLERFMVYGVIGSYAPLPAFWPFPGGADGAIVPIHEDDQLGDGGGWMLEYEATQNGVSTLLSAVDSGLSASGAAIIGRRGGEIGLAWKKPGTPDELHEAVGIGHFQPLAQPIGLADQLETLRDKLPINYVKTARITGGWWDRQWARPFKRMAAHDIRIDTSYAPRSGSGYAFGTGFPFLVVDENGQPLGIRELPIVAPSGVHQGPQLARLIKESARGHHETIGWAIRPDAFADFPDRDRFADWLSVFDLAQQYNHVITSALRLDRFMRSRRAGRIQSRIIHDVQPAQRRDSADSPSQKTDADPPPGNPGRATLLRITVESKRAGLSLTVPARLDGKPFDRAQHGANRIGEDVVSGDISTTDAAIAGYAFKRIPLDTGFNTIDVYYR